MSLCGKCGTDSEWGKFCDDCPEPIKKQKPVIVETKQDLPQDARIELPKDRPVPSGKHEEPENQPANDYEIVIPRYKVLENTTSCFTTANYPTSMTTYLCDSMTSFGDYD